MVEGMASLRSSGFIDPGWEHGTAQDEKKKKVKCNYCGKIVSGGIYRLKQHLARVSGEVTYCDKAPEEVYLRMKDNLEGCRSNRRLKHPQDDAQAYLTLHSNDDDEDEDQARYRRKGKQLAGDVNVAVNLNPLRSLGYVDPGWEHGVAQDLRKKKVKCNYCNKIVSGGINRFKQHLARIPGEVAPCKSAPEEVYLKIKENMKWHRTGRRHRRPNVKEITTLYAQSDNEDEDYEQDEGAPHFMSRGSMMVGGNRFGKDVKENFRRVSVPSSEPLLKKSRLDSVFLKAQRSETLPYHKQARLKKASTRVSRKEVVSAICRFFYNAGIPFQAANSLYFHNMLELIGQYGEGLVVPSSQLLSGRFLDEEVATIKSYLNECKASWSITGCSLIADSWRDTQGRTIINLLVSCPRGVYFVTSVDATDMLEDGNSLFKLMDKVVEEMGEENFVQVITENTPSYKAAGRMLEEKRRNLFWTPCAIHCIDQMLEDFLKIKCVRECMEKGQKITKFIYGQFWLLNLMKKEFTHGEELLVPSVTRYASSFATLQSLLDHKIGLQRMFLSSKWITSWFSKSEDGKEVESIVINSTFWKKVQHVIKSVDPVMHLLQKVENGENLSVSFIYNDIYNASLAIQSVHGDDPRKYGPFCSVIESHWNSLHHPLYMAAYSLNPSCRYHPDFIVHAEDRLEECINRLEQDNGRRNSARKQISEFVSAKADFGTDLARSTRTELDPAAWWQQHGVNCLELQRIAVRILSQACSSFGCEHNWSMYDYIHSKMRSHMTQRRLNDLIYVHYNLRLRERQIRKGFSNSTSLDSLLLEILLDEWVVETENYSFEEDEVLFYNEMQHVDAYENDMLSYHDGNAVTRKGSLELVTLADVDRLDAGDANGGTASDDDDHLDYFEGFSS